MTVADDVFDLDDPRVVADPYPVFEVLRAQGRPVWHDGLRLWLAARHVDANAVLRHRGLGRIFRAREPLDVWDTFNWLHADSILDSEPPKHTRLRALVAKAFARGHIERLRPTVHQLADGLLDDAEARARDTGSFDLIADYAEPLPVLVIAALLGVPDADVPLLRPWSQAIVTMYEYDRTAEQEADARGPRATSSPPTSRTWPPTGADEPADDLITHLAQVEAAGERLDERELVATARAAAERRARGVGERVRQRRRRRAAPSATSGGGSSATRGGWRRRPSRRCCASTRRCTCSSGPPPPRSRSTASSSRRARRSPRCSDRRTATRRSSTTPTGSTSAATPTRTSPSAPGSTSASAVRWPGSSWASRCRGSRSGCRRST